MDLGLTKKVALVAGSSKGLGFATARILLDEGAYVVITSRNEANLEKASKSLGSPNNLFSIKADVTHQEDCENLVQRTIERFNRLDILITNSGGPDPGNFEDLSNEQWDYAIQTSFKSHFLLIRAALPFLKKSEPASILTITSFTTKQPLENMILSNSIRSATIGLTKSLSFELGKYGIRVNSILPGWTITERVDTLLKKRADIKGSSVEAELATITADIPIGRMGNPDEFGRVAAFLVSPAASYVNGVMLNVDGGIYKGIY